ncbi:hypothetical protein XFF7767_110004 [Xanthomonas citri pv. fuscans]|nr:hypothetical protein XFF7767_110004 [Xanthomonas citri pv. fuscans]
MPVVLAVTNPNSLIPNHGTQWTNAHRLSRPGLSGQRGLRRIAGLRQVVLVIEGDRQSVDHHGRRLRRGDAGRLCTALDALLVTLFFSLPAALCVVLLSAALRRITNKPRTRALA